MADFSIVLENGVARSSTLSLPMIISSLSLVISVAGFLSQRRNQKFLHTRRLLDRYWSEEFRLADRFVTHDLPAYMARNDRPNIKLAGCMGFIGIKRFEGLTTTVPRLWSESNGTVRVDTLVRILTDYYHDVGFSVAHRTVNVKSLLDGDWRKIIATWTNLKPYIEEERCRIGDQYFRVFTDLVPIAEAELRGWWPARRAWLRYRVRNIRYPVK